MISDRIVAVVVSSTALHRLCLRDTQLRAPAAPVITLHDTACGCVIDCHVASDCPVASHTPALLVFVTRPSILGPTALLPHTHLCFACVCDQAVNIGPHTPALLVCVTRPSILGLTPALPVRLLVFVSSTAMLPPTAMLPHTHLRCLCV